jgi:hypothetical protein
VLRQAQLYAAQAVDGGLSLASTASGLQGDGHLVQMRAARMHHAHTHALQESIDHFSQRIQYSSAVPHDASEIEVARDDDDYLRAVSISRSLEDD